MANLKTRVSRKQGTPNFPKNEHFFPPITHESAKSRALRVYVLACLRVWLAFVIRVLCLRACYDACLACLGLAYSRFCLIIYFVCMNQGFAIKRKVASLNVQSP